ncbi:MAG: xylulokinase [Marinibacterium sp.]|nr:xylulokinase [Marinibacterium sp.]
MYLGLDLGTSGLRGILVDGEDRVLAEAEAQYPVSHPHPGWSEQDPAHWITALHQVLADLGAQAPGGLADLRALAFAGHMHGAVLLDRQGAVLRPCILWNDSRAADQADRLDADPAFRARTGNIVFPGFTAPKLAWVAAHEPALFDRVHKVLLPKDYLVWHLTGVAASEMSDAAGTGWLDTGARDWADDLLAATGLGRDHMPALFEGCDVVAPVSPARADALGLPRGVRVVAGAADNAAAACGAGALAEGQGFVSLGTSGVILTARDGFHPRPATAVHSFCHAVPGRWYQMGVMLAATDSLNWLARLLGDSPAVLTEGLGGGLRPPGAVRFLPYLSGERTPHNDSAVRGAFLGLDIADTRGDLVQGVIEGVSFGLRDSLEALRSAGADPAQLLAIGGGTGSAYWVDLLATVLGVPLVLPARGEFGAALGAARLARCGDSGADPETVMRPPRIARVVEPDPALQPAFDAAYGMFRDSYGALKAMPG